MTSVMQVKVPRMPPMFNVIVVALEKLLLAIWRTLTVWLLVMVPDDAVNAAPLIEYSLALTLDGEIETGLGVSIPVMVAEAEVHVLLRGKLPTAAKLNASGVVSGGGAAVTTTVMSVSPNG